MFSFPAGVPIQMRETAMRIQLFLLGLALALASQSLAVPSFSLDQLLHAHDSSSSDSDDSSSMDSSEDGQFLDNVPGWHPSLTCPRGQFQSSTGNCRQCSICGPDLYEREPCQANRDTRCEWCLSPLAMEGHKDFKAKCAQLVQLRNEFRRVMAQQKAGKNMPTGHVSTMHFSTVNMEASSWWKAEMAVEMGFYLALIVLVLAVLRFMCKARPTTYRTVHVNPPALDDLDQKNIVRAAESIREKLGKKGYDRLEEEFI